MIFNIIILILNAIGFTLNLNFVLYGKYKRFSAIIAGCNLFGIIIMIRIIVEASK